jgi:hypothetical protein
MLFAKLNQKSECQAFLKAIFAVRKFFYSIAIAGKSALFLISGICIPPAYWQSPEEPAIKIRNCNTSSKYK